MEIKCGYCKYAKINISLYLIPIPICKHKDHNKGKEDGNCYYWNKNLDCKNFRRSAQKENLREYNDNNINNLDKIIEYLEKVMIKQIKTKA